MKAEYINWDTDWSNCETIQPGRTRMKWCPTCMALHDKACFYHHRGSMMGCMLNLSNRSKAMAKIKGGAKSGVK